MSNSGRSFGSGNRHPAVLVDFDDTAAEQNVAQLLLDRFGDPTWKEVRQRFRTGELTLNEYQEITFRNIQADKPTMQGYVKENANLRPFFKELWDFCQSVDIPMAIVSQGLDFYIEALLEKEGHPGVPVYAVNTSFTPQGIKFHYLHARPGQEKHGNSKALVVDKFHQNGHYIFYAGDGLSDFEAAGSVDLLFAHRTLAEECARKDIPYRPFTDFGDMLQAVRDYGHWEKTTGDQTPGGSFQGRREEDFR